MDTIDRIKANYQNFIGTLVLNYFEVCRLLDIVDEEDDIYFKLYYPKRGIVLSSCVGRIFPLKGRLDSWEYTEIERVWNLNVVENTNTLMCISCKFCNTNASQNIVCKNNHSDHFNHILDREHLACELFKN